MTKKIRTEYMKKFKEPKWETFSKCYEDSVKYRLTRRVMEHAHKPLWFWEGWDTSTGSDSSASGRSTPKVRNKVAPLDIKLLTPPLKSESRESPEPKPPPVNGEPELEAKEFTLLDALPPTGICLLLLKILVYTCMLIHIVIRPAVDYAFELQTCMKKKGLNLLGLYTECTEH